MWRDHGIRIAVDVTARDLGVDCAGGRRRRVVVAKKRQGKARIRLARIAKMAKARKAAAKLKM